LLDEYSDEKREAWQKLGDWLDAILNFDNLISFNSGSRAI